MWEGNWFLLIRALNVLDTCDLWPTSFNSEVIMSVINVNQVYNWKTGKSSNEMRLFVHVGSSPRAVGSTPSRRLCLMDTDTWMSGVDFM